MGEPVRDLVERALVDLVGKRIRGRSIEGEVIDVQWRSDFGEPMVCIDLGNDDLRRLPLGALGHFMVVGG